MCTEREIYIDSSLLPLPRISLNTGTKCKGSWQENAGGNKLRLRHSELEATSFTSMERTKEKQRMLQFVHRNTEGMSGDMSFSSFFEDINRPLFKRGTKIIQNFKNERLKESD